MAIARALAGSPKLLLADEPTGNLDTHMARSVMELLEDINARGTTILMVTHDPELAVRAQRNVHIIDGQVSDMVRKPASLVEHRRRHRRRCNRSPPMFRYYVLLGVRNLARNPILTALMVLTLAVGVAASISTLTILHVMSGRSDPAQERSPPGAPARQRPGRSYVPGVQTDERQMSYRDAANLRRSGQGERRTGDLRRRRRDRVGDAPTCPVEQVQGLAVDADFFPMFEVPLLHGGRVVAQRRRGARPRGGAVARHAAKSPSESDNPVGKSLRLLGQDFRVVGSPRRMEPGAAVPRLINSSGGPLAGEDDLYIPFATAVDLQIYNNASTQLQRRTIASPATRAFSIPSARGSSSGSRSRRAGDRAALHDYLRDYAAEQRRLGRLPRDAPVMLFDVTRVDALLEVVSNDARLAVWLSFGFLLLCLVNTIGLLLAKFSARAPEVGVRRALGATRGAIFRQFLVEAGVVGLVGGLAGLRPERWRVSRSSRARPATCSTVAQMDWPMLGLTFVLALAASLLAGLLPTWRACQVDARPSTQVAVRR